jgi:Ribosomal protein S30
MYFCFVPMATTHLCSVNTSLTKLQFPFLPPLIGTSCVFNSQVEKQEKKKKRTGRAKRRIQYNRRFVNVVATFGRKKGPNSNTKWFHQLCNHISWQPMNCRIYLILSLYHCAVCYCTQLCNDQMIKQWLQYYYEIRLCCNTDDNIASAEFNVVWAVALSSLFSWINFHFPASCKDHEILWGLQWHSCKIIEGIVLISTDMKWHMTCVSGLRPKPWAPGLESSAINTKREQRCERNFCRDFLIVCWVFHGLYKQRQHAIGVDQGGGPDPINLVVMVRYVLDPSITLYWTPNVPDRSTPLHHSVSHVYIRPTMYCTF